MPSLRGEWYRFLTSGFIHADWMHLLVNMYVLYIFGDILEHYLLPLYFTRRPGWSIWPSIWEDDRLRHPPISNTVTTVCTALGASGAVSSIVFAGIPDQSVAGRNRPAVLTGITLPPVVFGGLYLLYSAIMARRQSDNVNHDAHFTVPFSA